MVAACLPRAAVAAAIAMGIVMALGAPAGAGLRATTTGLARGVSYTRYEDPEVPLVMHVVAVDVSSQELRLAATPPDGRGRTVSDFARCRGATGGPCTPSLVAINGDLFMPSGYHPLGLAVGNGVAWADAHDNALEGWLAFARDAHDLNRLDLEAPAAAAPTLAGLDGLVGGRALLVDQGRAQTRFDAADPTEPFRPAPRSALGLGAPGDDGSPPRALYLVVVDGDQARSAGVTALDLARFLVGLGADRAFELDGGGASALYLHDANLDGLASTPSDGVERPVANHLGVRYTPAPLHAQVVGQVFKTALGDNANLLTMKDVTVTVDGKPVRWNTDMPPGTVFFADDIEPHYTCVEASGPLYYGRRCRQITNDDIAVAPGRQVYASVEAPPRPHGAPDLGAPDLAFTPAPPPTIDLGGGSVHDLAAPPPRHTGSGCTLAARAPGAGVAPVVVLSLVAVAMRRRRRA